MLSVARRKVPLGKWDLPDEAVFAAYGWDAGVSDDEILAKLLALNLSRAK